MRVLLLLVAVSSVFVVRGGCGRWRRRGGGTEEEKCARTGSGGVGGRFSLVVWAGRKWSTCGWVWWVQVVVVVEVVEVAEVAVVVWVAMVVVVAVLVVAAVVVVVAAAFACVRMCRGDGGGRH